jgi:DNA polymerase-3 subunit beta
VTLPRGEFLDVVRRVGVVVQRTSPLQLRFAPGEVTVFARTQDVGEAKETVPVAFSGDAMEIGFNSEFLREGIESIAADELLLKLISPLRPAVIEGSSDDPTYLIMPIRLPG